DPANTVYENRISSIFPFGVNLFGQGRTMGDFDVEKSGVAIVNIDNDLAKYIDYGFDGRAVTLKRLTDPRGALSSAETVLKGSLEGLDSDSDMTAVRFRFYDRRRDLDTPIQQNFYGGTILGTSASIDGTPDLKGKPRP